MPLIINLLTFVLVLICFFLCLLILVQLPKKEAGLGQAFGGATTEALFGAGSGNALTMMTKYSAGAFLSLCVLLAWMNSSVAKSQNKDVLELLKKSTPAASATPIPGVGTAAPAIATTAVSNAVNAAAAAVTNATKPAPAK